MNIFVIFTQYILIFTDSLYVKHVREGKSYLDPNDKSRDESRPQEAMTMPVLLLGMPTIAMMMMMAIVMMMITMVTMMMLILKMMMLLMSTRNCDGCNQIQNGSHSGRNSTPMLSCKRFRIEI